MNYKQLTMMQRYQIEALKKEGLSQQAIVNNIGVHRSTICRELQRNSLDDGAYSALSASISARLRYQYKAKNRRVTKLHVSYIRKHLQEGWSPEQISGRMEHDGLDAISHETIYQYIYADQRKGGKLYLSLRHKHRKYHKRSAEYQRRGQLKNRVSIDERPSIVEAKERIGDWEVDTIIGRYHHQGIVTLVDRHSKFTLMKKVPSKHAEPVKQAIVDMMKPIQDYVLTITSDNGKEFAYHQEISRVLQSDFYFAHPYQSWQRGLNEHTNGLIREYFPKKTELQDVTDKQIIDVQNRLNSRPRKVLGYKTPAEVFFGKMMETYSAA
jgi:transposase, IS30 family